MLLHSWLFFALLTPLAWSVVNLLDVYFTQRVYHSPYDGVMVSGFFQGLFLFVPLFGLVETPYSSGYALIVGISAGILFQLACLYYFKALFSDSDVVMMQIIWNMNMAVLPLLLFLFLDRKLAGLQIVGIGITFCFSVLFCIDNAKRNKVVARSVKLMLLSMLFFSFSKGSEDLLYNYLNCPYWSGYLYFSIGTLITSLVTLLLQRSHFRIIIQNYKQFSMAEFASIIATASSMRAIQLSGSATLVVMLESYTPVFTLILTYALLFLFGLFRAFQAQKHAEMYRLQTSKLVLKLTATIGMSVGIYLVLGYQA